MTSCISPSGMGPWNTIYQVCLSGRTKLPCILRKSSTFVFVTMNDYYSCGFSMFSHPNELSRLRLPTVEL
jgi:hypothetical protein